MDWTNPQAKLSNYFTVKEALLLPQWNRLANEQDGLNDEIKANLLELFGKMDIVREYFAAPVIVHVTYRPEEYNKLIGGAKNSNHKFGKACDFHISGLDCDSARQKILADNKLEEWNMRMEDINGSWIHLDTSSPHPNRFFKP